MEQVTASNIIAFLGIVIAFLMLRSEQRRERRVERETQQERHEENLMALSRIREEIAGLRHLDECIDEMKEEIRELRRIVALKKDRAD